MLAPNSRPLLAVVIFGLAHAHGVYTFERPDSNAAEQTIVAPLSDFVQIGAHRTDRSQRSQQFSSLAILRGSIALQRALASRPLGLRSAAGLSVPFVAPETSRSPPHAPVSFNLIID